MSYAPLQILVAEFLRAGPYGRQQQWLRDHPVRPQINSIARMLLATCSMSSASSRAKMTTRQNGFLIGVDCIDLIGGGGVDFIAVRDPGVDLLQGHCSSSR